MKFDLIQIPKKCLKSEAVKLFTHLSHSKKSKLNILDKLFSGNAYVSPYGENRQELQGQARCHHSLLKASQMHPIFGF